MGNSAAMDLAFKLPPAVRAVESSRNAFDERIATEFGRLIPDFWAGIGDENHARFVAQIHLAKSPEEVRETVVAWIASWALHSSPGAFSPVESVGTEELAEELEALRPS